MDQNEDRENSELTRPTDENDESCDESSDGSTSEDEDSSEVDEARSMESPAIKRKVKKLTSAIRGLVLQMNPQHSDDQTEVGQQSVDYYDLTKLKNMQVGELQKHLLKGGEMCRKLKTELKIQEQTQLIEMEKIKQQFETKLTSKDKFCLELKEKMEQLYRVSKRGWKEQMTNLQEDNQKLLTEIKKIKENHLKKIKKLETKFKIELEAKDKLCLELKQQIGRQRGEQEVNVSCSICLDPWTQTGHHRLVSLACGHLFGDPCIREFLSKQQICPQCRAIASVAEIRYLFGLPV